jgi:anaerobic selenocysteine-containing dehydrogenase
MGSLGVMPKLKDVVFERLENVFGVRLPHAAGRDTMACMEGADAGELDVGFCLGGNLYGSNPDASFAERAMSKLDLVVYMSTTLNSGHAFGLGRETIILPVLPRDEEPQPTTQESMFNYVRLSDGGPARLAGPRSEIDVIASVAEAVAHARQVSTSKTLTDSGENGQSLAASGLNFVDWASMRNTGTIRQAIAQIVPGFEKIGEIDRTKQEFQIDGRTFHQPRFATKDGRAWLHAHRLPELQGTQDDEVRLMTIRSEGQFNTVVYEDEDHYRGVVQRDVILLNPKDLQRLHLADGQAVDVIGPAGTMSGIRATEFPAIRAGNAAMYFPEANVLVGRGVDPKSRTPAFKGVVVRVVAH